MTEAAVHTEGLSKTYRSGFRRHNVRALRELSLTVPQGQIFGLLGPNGAGKTTLVKTLLGIVRPTAGVAALFGVPVQRPSARRRTGYLPEDHRFPPYLTAEHTLDFYGALSGLPRRERQRRTDAALDAVGLLKWKKVKSRKYSKGMKQRLGIAQSLFHDPELVFLDEPTDGVDPLGRRAIRRIIVDLKEAGKTVFLNSHLLSEVEMVTDRILILRDGHALKEGTVEELTEAHGEYVFETRGPLGAVEESLRGLCVTYERSETGFRCSLKAEEDVDAVVDLLRGASVGLRSVVPVRLSLEEMFLKVLDEDGGEGEGA